jgi:tetratricopeptide (TPR) repeat protein
MWSKDYPPTGRWAWPSLLCLALLLGVVYLPSILRAEFLNFDDNLFFDPATNSQFVDGGLGQILHPARTIANVYLPVSHLSLYLDYQLTGTDPLWPHLHSLMLHVLAAWVLVHLGLALGLRPLGAFAVGACFAVHPALVESVAWVSSRKDVLSGLFAFLSLLAVAHNARAPGRGLAIWAVLAGALALYSKATAVVLPGLAALVCLLLGEGGRRRWLPVLGLGLVTLGAGLHHLLLAQGEGTLLAAASGGDLGLRASQVPGAYLHYLGVMIWPESLNILYPEVQTMEAFRGRFALGTAVLIATIGAGLCLSASSRFRLSGLALLGVLVVLLPFNTALPASSLAAADRYLYLAVPALALAWAGLGRVGTWLVLASCLPLAVLASGRTADFRDSERIWRQSLEVAPENAVARLNLSADLQRRRPSLVEERRQLLEQALADARYPVHRLRAQEALRNLALLRGFEAEALVHAERAVALAEQLPSTPEADLRRFQTALDAATLLTSAGRETEAEVYFARATALAPEHPTLLVHRASRLLAAAVEGGSSAVDDPRWVEAEALFSRVFATAPQHLEAHLVRGRWLEFRGEYLRASAEYEKGIAAAPERSEGYLALADLYINQGIYGDPQSGGGAEGAVRRGLARGIVDPALKQRQAIALWGQGSTRTAKRLLRDYLALRPRDRATARILADLLVNEALAGLHQLTIAELDGLIAEVEELDSGHRKLDIVQGKLARDRRQWELALEHLERARAVFPEDEDVLRMLAETHRDRGYQLLGFGVVPGAVEPASKEQRKTAAMNHFREFIDLAPPDLPTDSVRNSLAEEAKRLAARGVQHFRTDDLDEAETAFRRCVFLCPGDVPYQCQLGQVLMLTGRAGLEEAEALFAEATETQRRDGLDPSRPLLFLANALLMLDRRTEAERLVREFLADPGDADPATVQQIRLLLDG